MCVCVCVCVCVRERERERQRERGREKRKRYKTNIFLFSSEGAREGHTKEKTVEEMHATGDVTLSLTLFRTLHMVITLIGFIV